MRRPVLIEVEIEEIPDQSSLRGLILVDGIEVFARDLGMFSSNNADEPMEDAALELVSLFGLELGYYANTRERILTAAFEKED